MKKSRTALHTFFAVLCTLFITHYAVAEPTNLSLLKTELKQYHDSGEYSKDLNQILKKADTHLLSRVHSNAQHTHPQKLAIILDIDETSLSNYDNMVVHEFANTNEQINRYTREAVAPAIKPTLTLFNDALNHGVSVFFVTGRKESSRKATVKNLTRAGYHDWTGLFFKPENFNKASVIPYKTEARKKISQEGYTIIENLGDQTSDLEGGYAEKTYKLPNPYYHIP